MRRTGRTPIDVNADSRQKTVLEACIPLYTEGILSLYMGPTQFFKRQRNLKTKGSNSSAYAIRKTVLTCFFLLQMIP